MIDLILVRALASTDDVYGLYGCAHSDFDFDFGEIDAVVAVYSRTVRADSFD